MDKLKLYTHEEMLDAVVGVKGTPRRNKYEADIDNFLIGEAGLTHYNIRADAL